MTSRVRDLAFEIQSFGADAYPFITEMLTGTDARATEAAAFVVFQLGTAGKPFSRELLLASMKGSSWATHCLGAIRDPDAIPYLAERLNSEKRPVDPAYALGRMGSPGLRRLVEVALDPATSEEKFGVISDAIGALGLQHSLEKAQLSIAERDRNPIVRRRARELLFYLDHYPAP